MINTVINVLRKSSAIEAQYGSKVTVITMSLPSADTNLRGFAWRCRRRHFIDDGAFAGAVTLLHPYSCQSDQSARRADLVMPGQKAPTAQRADPVSVG